MVLELPISPQTEADLIAKAKAANVDVATYVTAIIEQAAKPPLSLAEISGPIAEDFRKSGLTEDELGDLLEDAKHEMRSEKRGRRTS